MRAVGRPRGVATTSWRSAVARSSARSASTTSPAKRPKGSARTSGGEASITSWRSSATAVSTRPRLRTIAFSDDIFAPARPWLEEFCARYKEEIGLPFTISSFPRMVDRRQDQPDARRRAVGDDHRHPVGLRAHPTRVLRARDVERGDHHGLREPRATRRRAKPRFHRRQPVRERATIVARPSICCPVCPKPFYFNYFSLTYFPGVDLTERALRDGFIGPDDVEDVAQKGYHLWGGALLPSRTPDELRWDVAYSLAVHGVPRALVTRLLDSPAYAHNIRRFAGLARQLRAAARWKIRRSADRIIGRPNLLRQFFENTNRDLASGEVPDPAELRQLAAQPAPARAPDRPSGSTRQAS